MRNKRAQIASEPRTSTDQAYAPLGILGPHSWIAWPTRLHLICAFKRGEVSWHFCECDNCTAHTIRAIYPINRAAVAFHSQCEVAEVNILILHLWANKTTISIAGNKKSSFLCVCVLQGKNRSMARLSPMKSDNIHEFMSIAHTLAPHTQKRPIVSSTNYKTILPELLSFSAFCVLLFSLS